MDNADAYQGPPAEAPADIQGRGPVLVPARVQERARAERAAVVVTDYYIARRQRVCLGWVPHTDATSEAKHLADILDWCHEQGCATVWLVAGTRTRPRTHYRAVTEARDGRGNVK